ncbi:anti-sigma B factor antagonist [Dethiosulfatibacter aminovorans DSM 17477]|uniref:Anti-sigma factor antagonist n=1 Tax=Dethiosulfatibacter aminovorans DSM 17477 TaxID=1121476 RepID=A0A1M6AMR3_9FIRM|nr:STAS domain-containing protein [Dethiosulfatibacter aminovorans]SHI37503.1 anti-sigma B factor antagonist [Dethiosulfatibacter aminovorans DSM 17477]
MALTIEKRMEENKIVVLPAGDIDIVTSPDFKEVVLDMFKDSNEILIDGENLEYMDSTGLGVLISLLKKTRSNNSKISLTNLKPNIYKLFDITGLTNVFEII